MHGRLVVEVAGVNDSIKEKLQCLFADAGRIDAVSSLSFGHKRVIADDSELIPDGADITKELYFLCGVYYVTEGNETLGMFLDLDRAEAYYDAEC